MEGTRISLNVTVHYLLSHVVKGNTLLNIAYIYLKITVHYLTKINIAYIFEDL